MRPAAFFPFLLLLAVNAWGAEMFKWTDAQGRTQYGQRPPPGVEAERLKRAPAPAPPPPANATPGERLEALEKRQDEQTQRETETQQKQQNAAQRKRYCDNARKNIALLGKGGHHRVKMPDGSYQAMDDAFVQRELEKNRRAEKTFCDPQ